MDSCHIGIVFPVSILTCVLSSACHFTYACQISYYLDDRQRSNDVISNFQYGGHTVGNVGSGLVGLSRVQTTDFVGQFFKTDAWFSSADKMDDDDDAAAAVFFTALHVMQMRYSEENSVCLSVRLSVRLSHASDKTEERSVQIFTPYERTFILVFWEEEWLVGATCSTWNFGPTDPHWSEITDFWPISLVAPQP